MDNVHHPEARAWISAKIKIKDYFAEYKKAIEHHGRGGMSAKKMIEEKKKLSVNHLRSGPKLIFFQFAFCKEPSCAWWWANQ